MSSYLWATSGHCILLHTKESLCTTQSPRKWWDKGKNCGFIEKEMFALGTVQQSLLCKILLQKM